MAKIQIDLKSIAPHISEKIDAIRTKTDELEHLARELYMDLGYHLEVPAETEEKSSTPNE